MKANDASAPSQLTLLDLPQAETSPRAKRGAGRRADPATAVRYCQLILAELDRVTASQQTSARRFDHQARQLVSLFEAAERVTTAADRTQAHRQRAGA